MASAGGEDLHDREIVGRQHARSEEGDDIGVRTRGKLASERASERAGTCEGTRARVRRGVGPSGVGEHTISTSLRKRTRSTWQTGERRALVRDGETERRRDGAIRGVPTPVEFNTDRLSYDGFLDGDVPAEPVASEDGRLGSLGQGPGVGQGLRGNAEGNGERGGQVVPAGLGLCELAELDEGGLERESVGCQVDGRVGEWRRQANCTHHTLQAIARGHYNVARRRRRRRRRRSLLPA